MLHFDHPMVLEISNDERDRALVWLMKNHPKLDCLVLDNDDGAEIRVRDEDVAVLDSLAAMLDRG